MYLLSNRNITCTNSLLDIKRRVFLIFFETEKGREKKNKPLKQINYLLRAHVHFFLHLLHSEMANDG